MEAARLERKATRWERLSDVREDERRRLARDLHDGPAQSLAAALFGVDLAIASFTRDPAGAGDELARARELLRDAIDDLRLMMAGLRPRLLDERGLVAALEALAGATPLWGPRISVDVCGLAAEQRLEPDVELALYRIAQEAISNARRHGSASHVIVQVRLTSEEIALSIADDGHGFVPRRIGPLGRSGQGLPGMRKRARLLGGEFVIESSLGAGTRIEVSVPLTDGATGLREGKA